MASSSFEVIITHKDRIYLFKKKLYNQWYRLRFFCKICIPVHFNKFNNLSNQKEVENYFFSKFNHSPELTFRAPGRINILGEHTDYNQGFVMPSAISYAIYFCISLRTDLKLEIEAVDLKKNISFENINQINIEEKNWSNHLTGVIKEIQKLGKNFEHGLNVCYGGNIPNGGGLSSSAAVEAGFAFALNNIFQLNLELLTLAEISQKTEHNYIGVNCGIMDMYASLFSKKDHILRLDCRTLKSELLPAKFEKHKFVLVNSGVKHNLADSEYNVRRKQCQVGLEVLKKKYIGIESLRDVSLLQLESIKGKIDNLTFNRCLYVIEENLRVEKAVTALENHDFKTLGELMKETHIGLSQLYEVSCPELDYLFQIAEKFKGVLGSRMMGGGFGGCTLNLIEKDFEESFITFISQKYLEKFGKIPEIYSVELSEGVSQIEP